MWVPRTTFKQWLNTELGSVMPLLVVLLAVLALPGCPRVAGMEMTSEDVRTVTEQRPVSQTFSRPGHYLLHQTEMLAEPCVGCDEHEDRLQSGITSQTVITVDVLPKSAETPQLVVAATGERPDLAVFTMHAGHVTNVPAPPPRAA